MFLVQYFREGYKVEIYNYIFIFFQTTISNNYVHSQPEANVVSLLCMEGVENLVWNFSNLRPIEVLV